jgi:hypothetical protein
VTETFLLFLSADFIIADGSYRRLAELMREGKRVIQAPSFRVVLEDVWPARSAGRCRERRARGQAARRGARPEHEATFR